MLNLSGVLAATCVVLFIITFIGSNCFLKPYSSSMQIVCIPDFLSKIKPTMTLLCKQSQYFRALQSLPFENKTLSGIQMGLPDGALQCTRPWELRGSSTAAGTHSLALPPSLGHPASCSLQDGCPPHPRILPPTSGHRMSSRGTSKITQRLPLRSSRFSLT